MTQVISKFEDIRNFLDEMIENETTKRTQLKSQIDELKKQEAPKSSSSSSNQSLLKDEDVVLHFGTKSFKKFIKPNADINDLYSMASLNLGTSDIGYKDSKDHDSITALRTTQDLKYAFTIYTVEQFPFLHVVALKKEDADAIKKFNLRKENMNKNNDCSVFKVKAFGKDEALLFLAIPTKFTNPEGMNYLRSIFGSIASLYFIDEDGDEIEIVSDEAWNYSMSAAFLMNKKGKYPHLTINLS